MGERKDKKEKIEEGKEKKKREIGVKKRETILIFVSLFNIMTAKKSSKNREEF